MNRTDDIYARACHIVDEAHKAVWDGSEQRKNEIEAKEAQLRKDDESLRARLSQPFPPARSRFATEHRGD